MHRTNEVINMQYQRTLSEEKKLYIVWWTSIQWWTCLMNCKDDHIASDYFWGRSPLAMLASNGHINWTFFLMQNGLPRSFSDKEFPCQCKETQEMWVWSLSQEDPLEEEMATHSSILAGESNGYRGLVGYCPQSC